MAPATPTYEPRDPSRTVLYKVVSEHLETFLASLDADPGATGLPAYMQREFYDYLQRGIFGSVGAPAPRAPGPRWRVFGAAQSAAWSDHPDATQQGAERDDARTGRLAGAWRGC